MPETPHHAFELTVSLADHVTETMRQEIKEFMRARCLWWGIKGENGESGKTHLHGFLIFEIASAQQGGGAKTISNLKRDLLSRCPALSSYLLAAPSKHAVVVASGKSDVFIAEYLQKEASLTAFYLPEDLNMLVPYFSDLQAKKPKNPEYEQWASMYRKDGRIDPATPESVWEFWAYHMYQALEPEDQMKILSDPRKLKERTISMVAYLNREMPAMPASVLGKREKDDCRWCPRCIEKDRDVPSLLGYREQFCALCKNY